MYIFLDLDGVLVTEDSASLDDSGDLTAFNPVCLAHFESIIRQHAQAKIVIVSRWRELFDLDTIRRRFSADMRVRIVGAAPLTSQPAKYFRFQEIIDYLGQHQLLHHPWLVISSQRAHFPPPALVIAPDPTLGFSATEAGELESFLLQAEAPPPTHSPTPITAGVLGLGWDGVVSSYGADFAFLAQTFKQCVIITANDEITLEQAAAILKLETQRLHLVICPAARLDDLPAWTVEQCRLHQVELLFDNDENIIRACRRFGIHAITVQELGA
jgi:hypothetical protein